MSKEKKKWVSKKDRLKRLLSDPKTYIENLIKIVDKNGQLVPFVFNELQADFVKNLEKYNVILKARQLGFSSIALALSLYYANTQANTTCLLMSYSIDSATGIFEKLKTMYWTIPDVLRVKLINNNKKELKFVNGSRIIVCTCGNKDVARGLTIKFAHLSEVAFMKDTINKQLLAIEQALVPDGVMILESTANGLNYFHQLWQKAKKGENMYKPFFYNWYENKSMFEKDYANAVDVWTARGNKMLDPDSLTSEEMDLYSKGATIEQLVWRRLKINNASEEEFQQEFPSSDIEAFITTGNAIFDSKLIVERERYIVNPKEKKSIPGLPEILNRYYGKSFSIWHTPEQGMKYYIGVDSAEGVGQDYSVCVVVNEDGEQVAEFRDNKIAPHIFAELVKELGHYYNYAYLVVEKASAGHTVISRLRFDYNYMNMHKHKAYDARGKRKKKVGWETTQVTKPMMISDLREMFETGQILINSRLILEEMKTFVAEGSSMNAMKGSHDDLLMSLAMAIQGIKAGFWYA